MSFIALGKGRFILDCSEDYFALAAMDAYATACSLSDPVLAKEILLQIHKPALSGLCTESIRDLLVAMSASQTTDDCESRS